MIILNHVCYLEKEADCSNITMDKIQVLFFMNFVNRRKREGCFMEKLGRNDKCWCESGKKYKQCHYAMDEKIEAFAIAGHMIPDRDMIKNPMQIEGIRESSKINIAVLDYVAEHIKQGMSTAEIDKMVYDKTIELGGIPAPLHYEGFPKSVCTSRNNEVCHGIPSEDIFLLDGDIVNVDVSTIYNGFYSDSSRMFCIGNVSEENKKLVEVAKQAVQVGLSEVKPYNFIGDMGQAIQDYVKAQGFSVVLDFGGHGVGLEFHEEPMITYVGPRKTEMLMVPGMVFTIEPMINAGKPDVIIDDESGWIVYTEDGSMSAQWEVTVLVTEDGYEILTY